MHGNVQNSSTRVKHFFLYQCFILKKPQDAKFSPLTLIVKGKIVFIESNLFKDCILLLSVLPRCKKVTHLADLILRDLKLNFHFLLI